MASISFEILLRDENYSKLGTWKFKQNDAGKFLRILNKKFDLGLSIKDSNKMDNDLDWAR